MKNVMLFASLINKNLIRLTVFSEINKPDNTPIFLIKDDTLVSTLQVIKKYNMPNVTIYELKPSEAIVLGHKFHIVIDSFGRTNLIVNEYSLDPSFDDEYFYDGDDLGAVYSPNSTTFTLWAPLSSDVMLKLSKNKGVKFHYYKMIRESKGIFRLTLDGNYEDAYYSFIVDNSGVKNEVLDPYGKASTVNAGFSVVLNPKKIRIDLEENVPEKLMKYTDAVIYETSVRDITIDNASNIKNKGKFLGLTEEKVTTKCGNPSGIDHLKNLGITHVQLMPVADFKTVDELNPDLKYNWGYDPWQFFVPEGSYASKLEDPISRILDLKRMIKSFHHNGIKVVLDIVLNHVFDYEFQTFEKIVPNYFFRRQDNGMMSNGSGCGNDIASERKMVQKLIFDTCNYWIKEFGIDGYRFDLMAIIDKHTMNKIYRSAIEIKPDFILYGEGWNMQTNLPDALKTSENNALGLGKISFFNETFRDVVKGPTNEFEFNKKGYLTGNTSYIEGFKYVFLGGCIDQLYNRKFINAAQSVNYVECHDNGTLFDKITACGFNDTKTVLNILKTINASIILSFGIPFFHMGQEIGLSKNMNQNTYNKPDKYNKFKYDILDQRIEYVNYLKSLIKFRKENPWLRLDNPDEIKKMVSFNNLNNGGIEIIYNKVQFKDKKVDMHLIYNPTGESYIYESDKTIKLTISDVGYMNNKVITLKSLIVGPYTCAMFYEED